MPPLDDTSLVPLPTSAREDGAERDSPSYDLEFSRNTARIYEPVPVVFGRHRVVPPLGARTKSEVVDGEVIQTLLVVWGFGPCVVSDLRISGRPVAEYADISIETREGRVGDPALTLYAGTPIQTVHPLAHSAIRVRVTDQLPRRVDEISGIVSAHALDWIAGSSSWIRGATSNPASMVRLALQHPGRRRPAPDAEIDLTALQAFHGFCEANGYEFNGVLDVRRSIWDVVTDICAVARARPTLADGVWSVVWDVESAEPVDHFCALNIDRFRVERTYERRPEAVRVRFPNRERDWRRDERTIYRTGFSASNATEIETVSPYGITDPEHVWKFGSRYLAQLQESEGWSGTISTENIELSRGDRVTVSHETIGAGFASAWIAEVDDDNQGRDRDLTLDAPILFGSDTYAAKIRTDTDADLVVELVGVTADETARTVRIRTADRPAGGTIKPGDLVSFGVEGKVRAEAIVTDIDRQGDLAASISMVPVRQAVYDAEKGAIPDFTSTLEDISTPLPPLVIDSIASDISVRRQIGNVVAPRMQVDINPVPVAGARIECQIQEPDASEFGPSALEKVGNTRIVVGDLEVGELYRFRARWTLPEDNRIGEWTEDTHRVQQLRPGNPGSFSVNTDQGGLRRYEWSPPSDMDLAGVRIRYGAVGEAWGSMTALHAGLLTSSPWWAYSPPPGRYSFEIRAVDTDGLESTGLRLDGDAVTLGAVRNLGRFHELTAFRKQAVGDAAPARPTDGEYSFASATFTPPTGWDDDWPPHDATEVVYGVAATAQDQEGDPWTADSDDWSDPAIISDAGDINIIYRRGSATGGTVIGTRADYTGPEAPAASAGVPEDWHDDIAEVPDGPGLIYASIGLRRRGQTLFNWGTPEAFEGQPGVDGVSAREIPIYQKIGLAAALPGAPSTATWDHSAGTLGSIGDWSQEFPTYNAATEKVACTIATGFANDTLSSWAPVRVCEAAGDINAVYARYAVGTTPDAPETGAARVPTGWIDVSASLTGSGLAWMTVGHRAIGQANWTWSTPTRIAALDGADGEDGEPGRAGLTGSAGRITRATRVATRGATGANTEWHMGSSSFNGERTINLGNVNDAEKTLIDLILDGGIVTLFHDPENWSDYALDSVAYATVSGTRQARLKLDYIEHIGVPPAVGDVAGTTMHFQFTPQGRPGTAGVNAPPSGRELTLYQKITLGAAAPTAPASASWDHSSDSLTSIGQWSRQFPTYNAVIERVVCTLATGLSDDTLTDWSTVRTCEAAGDLNAIYRRADSGDTPSTPSKGTARVPSGWVDDPASLTGSGLAWVSIGHRPWGDANWTWGAPNRIEGLDGIDGDDGEPGIRGLTGSAARISRVTRVGSQGAANTNTEWHLSGTAGSWDVATRTLSLGGTSSDDRGLLSRLENGAIITLFHDPENWADYTLRSAVSYGSNALATQARLSLAFIEEVGVPPLVGDASGTTCHVHITPAGAAADGEGGADGSNGTSFKELQAYLKQSLVDEMGDAIAPPGNPHDTIESASNDWGSYNFASGTFTPPTGWQELFPTVAAGEAVYAVFTTADDSAGDPWEAGTSDWLGPVLIDQPAQVLVVYQRRANSGSAPGATTGVPSGWQDEVENVPAGSNPIFVTLGTRLRGQTLYTWQRPTKLEGQDGSDGINGATWRNGDTAPGSNLGNVGDFYLRDNGLVYEKTGATTWTNRTNLRGAQGATWFNGTTDPNNANPAIGANGDFYFQTGSDSVAGTIWKKNAGAWTKQVDIDQGSEGSVWHSATDDPDTSLGNDMNWFFNTESGEVFEKEEGVWESRAELYDLDREAVEGQTETLVCRIQNKASGWANFASWIPASYGNNLSAVVGPSENIVAKVKCGNVFPAYITGRMPLLTGLAYSDGSAISASWNVALTLLGYFADAEGKKYPVSNAYISTGRLSVSHINSFLMINDDSATLGERINFYTLDDEAYAGGDADGVSLGFSAYPVRAYRVGSAFPASNVQELIRMETNASSSQQSPFPAPAQLTDEGTIEVQRIVDITGSSALVSGNLPGPAFEFVVEVIAGVYIATTESDDDRTVDVSYRGLELTMVGIQR